jgi:hypothetical protein
VPLLLPLPPPLLPREKLTILKYAGYSVIRTVRRFLERYGNKVDALLFVFANPEEQRPYDKVRLAARAGQSISSATSQKDILTVQCVDVPCRSLWPKILPLYFPRNKAEQYRAVPLLPEDVGNESGETVVAERQVRVGESYQGAAAGGSSGLPAPTGYEHDEWLEPEQDPTMLAGGDGGAQPGGVELARYLQLLEAAKEMDLKAIEDRNIMYRAGKDSTGLPVRTHFTPLSSAGN